MVGRQSFIGAALVGLVAVPGFHLGQQVRHGGSSVVLLAVCAVMVVLLAGAIMRQMD